MVWWWVWPIVGGFGVGKGDGTTRYRGRGQHDCGGITIQGATCLWR